MGDKTHIPYVDASWNFLRGCTRKSLGCSNCYAEHISARFSEPGQPYEGLATMRGGKPQWSGEVRFIPKRIEDPLRWKKSRVTFVNSMSDTFHPGVPLEVLDMAFDTMERCPDHTFLLFTKRPERMRVYLAARYGDNGVPSHIWPGTTVESNEYRYRAQILAEIPAAVRFLSCEPLLGPLDLENFLAPLMPTIEPATSPFEGCGLPSITGWQRKRLFDWVMVGGESGLGARPMHPDWVRSLQKQCEAAGTAFWFKQWGEWIPMLGQRHGIPVKKDKYQFPDGEVMGLAGAKAAGNLLDGKLYEERPTPRQRHDQTVSVRRELPGDTGAQLFA